MEGRALSIFYSTELAEQITDLYQNGQSLMAISRIEGMPGYSTINKWIKQNTEFRSLLDGARQSRAVLFEEKAIAVATNEGLGKDDVPAARLAFDAFCWGAAVNDPGRYGKKTTVSGDPDKPFTFVIKTGVPDPLPHQMPPELDSAGVVKRTIVVDAVVEDNSDTAFTPSHPTKEE